MRTSNTPIVAIAGVGNLLRSDDGVGIHAIQLLQQTPCAGVDIVEVGTAALHAVGCLAPAWRVLLLDAVQAGEPPGTVYCFDPDSRCRNPQSLSVHALGVLEAFALLSPERQPRFTVLGVEPGSLDYGLTLTPPVTAALPRLVAEARSIVQRWLGEMNPGGKPGRSPGTRKQGIAT